MAMYYLNGELQPADRPALLPTDRGFTLGDGLFETMRAVEGRVVHLAAHLRRLADGAARLQIPLDAASLPAVIARTLEANRLHRADATLRLTLSRGPAPRGLAPPPHPQPTLVITAAPYTPYPASLYRRGMKAILLPQRRNEFAATVSLKTLNYLEAIVGKGQAAAAGAEEGIFCNTAGFLAEACTANLFFVRSGELYTPADACGLVPGVVRGEVLSLAREAGIPVRLGRYTPDDLRRSDEAFLTNSLMGVMPLTEVDGRKIGDGQPGRLTRTLAARYGASVEAIRGNGDSEIGG
ncbi:MAG: hypothetical protein D6796_13445 [Caldilineae bacterium]|nr:MAG: hypothetical protein D6796_13445 [Caldilineae bacterium]